MKRKGTTEGRAPIRKVPDEEYIAMYGERRSESTMPNSRTFIALSSTSSFREKISTAASMSSSATFMSAKNPRSWFTSPCRKCLMCVRSSATSESNTSS